jgi:plasmid maintenance system killer protein
MIKSFRHKGIQKFFETGSKAGIQAAHAPRLARQLHQLDVAKQPQDMASLAGNSTLLRANWQDTGQSGYPATGA